MILDKPPHLLQPETDSLSFSGEGAARASKPDNFARLFPPGRRYKIFVVDDDPNICEVLEMALGKMDLDVVSFLDSRKAQEAFKSMQPDMIVADWVMPELDGLTLIGNLKTQKPDLSAMLITGLGSHELVLDAYTSGQIDTFLAKPFKLNHFFKAITRTLQNRAERESFRAASRRMYEEASITNAELTQKARQLVELNQTLDIENRELMARQEILLQNAVKLERVLQGAMDGIAMITAEGRFTFFNKGAEDIFGCSSEEALAGNISDFCPDYSPIPSELERFFIGPKKSGYLEAPMRRKNGENFYAMLSVSDAAVPPLGPPTLLLLVKEIPAPSQNRKVEASAYITELEKLAITDYLTNLFNRRHMARKLEEEMKRARRHKSDLSVLLVDIDHLKNINNTFGRVLGDTVLVEAAKELVAGLREVDIVSRWDGGEFLLALPQTNAEMAGLVAERLRRAMMESPRWGLLSPELSITVSTALLTLPQTGLDSVERLVDALGRTLALAKADGRGLIRVFQA